MLWSEITGMVFLVGAITLGIIWVTTNSSERQPWLLPLALHLAPLGIGFLLHPISGLFVLGFMGAGYGLGFWPKQEWIDALGASVPWWAKLAPVVLITIVINAELTRFALLVIGAGLWWATHHADTLKVLGAWNIMAIKQTRYLGMIMILIGGIWALQNMSYEGLLALVVGLIWFWTDPHAKDIFPKAKKAFWELLAKLGVV